MGILTTIEDRKTSNLFIIVQLVMYAAMLSAYKGVAYYIAIVADFLLLVEIIGTSKGKIPTNKSWNSFMLFMVFYTATSLINFHPDNYYVYAAYYVLVFFPLLIFEYLKNCSTETIRKSLKSFFFVLVCFCIIATGYYIANPGFARELSSVEEQMAIGGGYFLAYAAAILCVYIFSKMLNGRIEKKISYVLLCILFVCVVYLTQSSITTMAMFMGIIIALVTKGRETSGNLMEDIIKFGFIGICAIIVLSVIVYNKYVIAEWILEFVEGKDTNILYSRIEEIVNSFVYGKNTGHYDRRSGTLTDSIEVIKRYPLFGVGYKYGNVFDQGRYWGLGDHSEILDALARYGIFGGFLWLYPYFRTIKHILRKNLGTAVTVLLLMYFNPFMSFHSNAVMFLFIPLFEELLRRKEQEESKVTTGKEY